MDTKKQASIADALAKGVMVKIPELESHVPDFFRGMIPAVTPAQEAEIGVYLGKVAAKASDDWDAAHQPSAAVPIKDVPKPGNVP